EIRQTFIKMLQEEIDQFADLTDYGKLKGWLRIPPHYHSPT
ncbi:MAG: spore coat protein, partial [Firmicutes bacterium]|nr:spore coat protein [Bacillota bacterium]